MKHYLALIGTAYVSIFLFRLDTLFFSLILNERLLLFLNFVIVSLLVKYFYLDSKPVVISTDSDYYKQISTKKKILEARYSSEGSESFFLILDKLFCFILPFMADHFHSQIDSILKSYNPLPSFMVKK